MFDLPHIGGSQRLGNVLLIAAWACLGTTVAAAPLQLDPAIPVPAELRQRNQQPGKAQPTTANPDNAPTLPSNDDLLKRTPSPLAVELVGELGAAGYAQRRAAAERLQRGEVPLEDLLTLLAKGGLSIEQHHRLLAITFDRIVNAPRGALGIQMESAGVATGVRISRVIAGFPAEKHLQVDDVIVAIDGRAIQSSEDLLLIVQGHPPGTEVRVEAVRGERDARGKVRLDEAGQPITRRIDVRVPLGSKRELDNAEPATRGFGRDPLDTARQELGRSLLRRFPPTVLNTRLPDDAKVEAEFASRSVDRHELVETLMAEIDSARRDQRAIQPHKLGWYRAQGRALREFSKDMSTSEAERGWYRRVADRVDELLVTAESIASESEAAAKPTAVPGPGDDPK